MSILVVFHRSGYNKVGQNGDNVNNVHNVADEDGLGWTRGKPHGDFKGKPDYTKCFDQPKWINSQFPPLAHSLHNGDFGEALTSGNRRPITSGTGGVLGQGGRGGLGHVRRRTIKIFDSLLKVGQCFEAKRNN